MPIDKTNWIMFIFGFLLDKINLFPFILGLFFGIYITKNISPNIEMNNLVIIYNYIKNFFNSIIDKNINNNMKKTENDTSCINKINPVKDNIKNL